MGGRSAICSAVKVLLAMEMRQLKVPTFEQSKRLPGGLGTGQTAIRCTIRSTSGATTSAVLAGPAEGGLRASFQEIFLVLSIRC